MGTLNPCTTYASQLAQMVCRGCHIAWSTDNAANGQKPDHHRHDFGQPCSISTHHAIHGNLPKEVKANIEIENRTDANGPKEPYKEGLLLFFNLIDMPVHGIDDRYAAKEKDQDAKEDQSVDWNDIIVAEDGPWADAAEVYED